MHSKLNNKFFNLEVILFSILYFSLLIGFLYNENSTGGAYLDYVNQKKISQAFSENFFQSFLNYDSFTTRHSPVLIIFLSFFENLSLNDNILRIFHLHLCLLLPLFFYLSLKIKYTEINNSILLLVTGLIFLSPTFRSLSIWPDSRILGLTFFCISIYFFLRFSTEKKFIFAISNILFYAIASYFSPNFSVFSVFFLYKYFSLINYKSFKFIIIIVVNIFLAIPAIYYVFVLDINFLNKSAAIGMGDKESIFFNNIFNQILIIPTIIVFYIFPLIILKIINISKIIDIKNIVLSTILLLISIYFFDYKYEYSGGGIFFKISYYLFNNNVLFYCISLASLILLFKLISKNFENILLILVLFLSNPQITIYHKYYDPLILILILLLFKIDIKLELLKNLKKIFIIYIYFIFFLLLSLLKSYA